MKRKKTLKPLTNLQKQAAQLIFDGHRIGEIATKIGVHRCTIWRWYRRRDFQQEINRIHDKYVRERRRQWLREYHQSPEYKRRQSRRAYARRRLRILAIRLEKAGNSGDIKAYEKISKEYDKCFNDAYFDGKTLLSVLNSSRFLSSEKKRRKPKKYIIEII